MFEAILFDCDGVLFDSLKANLAFYSSVLNALGAPAIDPTDAARVELCHTASSRVVFDTLLGPQKGKEALALAAQMTFDGFIGSMEPQPGLMSALGRLADQLPLGVATNRGASIHAIVRHFELSHLFRSVVCCLDVAQPKPAPDMVLLAAQQLGCSPRALLFVGDSELDRQAALAAGATFAAFRTSVKGDYALSSFDELVALFSV